MPIPGLIGEISVAVIAATVVWFAGSMKATLETIEANHERSVQNREILDGESGHFQSVTERLDSIEDKLERRRKA